VTGLAMQRMQIQSRYHTESVTQEQVESTYKIGMIAHRLIEISRHKQEHVKPDNVLVSAFNHFKNTDLATTSMHHHDVFMKDHYAQMQNHLVEAHQHQQQLNHQRDQMQREHEMQRELTRGFEIGF
jgi:hypothetical protein